MATNRRLTAKQRRDLMRMEATVEAGLRTYIEVGRALAHISGDRLYRETHSSFEAYLRERWNLSRRYGYSLIEAARVADAMEVPSEAQLPLGHARLLAPLSMEQRLALMPLIAGKTVSQARAIVRAHFDEKFANVAPIGDAGPLPTGKFRTILADPPWQGRSNSPEMRTPYPTMSTDEITALDVESLAADDSHLYLWATPQQLPDALQVLEAWGFDYRSTIAWVKPGVSTGRYFRGCLELMLFGVRGSLPTQGTSQPNWFEAPRLIGAGRHSRKPDRAYEVIEVASPESRLELFARGQPRPGWTTWGNQAGGTGLAA